MLAYWRFLNIIFLNDNITGLAEILGYTNNIPYLTILLPIGLSFHTFQAMSYTFEVYRGNQPAERNFGIYSLYVMFYPQLVAGPIERPQNVIHQFYEKHTFNYQRVVDGLKLMAWGLFKKIVIADRLAVMVNQVYNNPTDHNGGVLIIATIFFAYQIYCDFSGYSDIAIGSAKVMGFELMQNFNRPYFAKTIPEFWRRWHISLSTWFRDYLYIPLGGNKVAKWRWYYNIFIVFLVSGLWHGASWTFIVWGALHGFYQVFGALTKNWRNKFVEGIGVTKFPFFYKLLQIASTFILVCIAWVYFRANNISDANYIVSHFFTDWQFDRSLILGGSLKDFAFAILFIIVLESIHLLERRIKLRDAIAKQPGIVRWAGYVAYFLVLILFGVFSHNEFIYFQF